MLRIQSRLLLQVIEAEGLQKLLSLLPAPEPPTSADAALTAPATAASTFAALSNKPTSHRLQTCLLQLLAAILQLPQARSVILAASSESSINSTSCCALLLNILDQEAPAAPAAPPAAAAAPAGGKGAAVGKADAKAKATGKGKAEAVLTVPSAPPAELMPPFLASVQLPAVQCLQVRPLLEARLSHVLRLLAVHIKLKCCLKPSNVRKMLLRIILFLMNFL